MKRRTYIGVGVKGIKILGYLNKDVVPFKLSGTQILLRRINEIYKAGYSICNDNEVHIFFEGGNIEKEGIN